MAPKSKPQQQKKKSCCSLTGVLTFFSILIGILSPIVYLIEKNLEKFYFLDLEHLQDLTQRAINSYPNDTTAIVNYIVTELHEKHPNYINPKHDDPEEWFFNNAGGAMGGMYIIHASKSTLSSSLSLSIPFPLLLSSCPLSLFPTPLPP